MDTDSGSDSDTIIQSSYLSSIITNEKQNFVSNDKRSLSYPINTWSLDRILREDFGWDTCSGAHLIRDIELMVGEVEDTRARVAGIAEGHITMTGKGNSRFGKAFTHKISP